MLSPDLNIGHTVHEACRVSLEHKGTLRRHASGQIEEYLGELVTPLGWRYSRRNLGVPETMVQYEFVSALHVPGAYESKHPNQISS